MSGDEPSTGDDDATAEDRTTGNAAVEEAADAAADGESLVGDFPVTRRKALVGGLGVVVGAGVGAGATIATQDSNQVRKQRPNSDGKGTLGELRWILEEKHQLAVSSMVHEGETVTVTYESGADSREASRREIGSVISAYGLIVANDGPTEKLSADIDRRFEDQATSYHVQAEWVMQWRSGDISDASVAQRVFNTRKFPESAESE